jgi:hypothetical protein
MTGARTGLRYGARPPEISNTAPVVELRLPISAPLLKL